MPNLIDSVRHVVVVTGAGFSQPSGLPVYRNSSAGWLDAKTEKMSNASRYGNHLGELWPRWHELARAALDAQPNAAHRALVRWERQLMERDKPGSMTIVTQNIDGLHQRAGSLHVLEAHGTILKARRLHRAHLFDYVPDPGDPRPPQAPDGSRRTRPDVVLFGEQPRHMEEALRAIQSADLVIFAGTSGRVWPIAGLPAIAREHGVHTMLWNLEEWDSAQFDLVVEENVLALDELVPHETQG